MDCRKCESGKVMEVHGIRWCTLQGLEIIQVEILSNKLLTTAFEASLGCMVVTLYAKRRQQGNRDSYRAPKSHKSERRLCGLEGRQNTGLS